MFRVLCAFGSASILICIFTDNQSPGWDEDSSWAGPGSSCVSCFVVDEIGEQEIEFLVARWFSGMDQVAAAVDKTHF